jgi:hypothetical protein
LFSIIAQVFSLKAWRSKLSKFSTISGIITSASPMQSKSKKGRRGKGFEETAAPPAIKIGRVLFEERGSTPIFVMIFKASK